MATLTFTQQVLEALEHGRVRFHSHTSPDGRFEVTIDIGGTDPYVDPVVIIGERLMSFPDGDESQQLAAACSALRMLAQRIQERRHG